MVNISWKMKCSKIKPKGAKSRHIAGGEDSLERKERLLHQLSE